MGRLVCLVLLAVLLAPVVSAEEDAYDREAILSLLAPRRGESIADVGCGLGTWSVALAKAVGSEGRVYAVDIDPNAVAAARRRIEKEGVENVEVKVSQADDPGLPADSVDAIFLNDVIDWVERSALAGFLAGLRVALKTNGRLVIRDPSGGPDRVIAELYRAGFSLVEAKIPLERAPSRSFGTGWYALKVRRAEVQPSILPRLGRPARYRVRLQIAEELFRLGLLTREELRAKWETIRDRPGPFDPAVDEARDLTEAALALDVLTEEEAARVLERARGGAR